MNAPKVYLSTTDRFWWATSFLGAAGMIVSLIGGGLSVGWYTGWDGALMVVSLSGLAFHFFACFWLVVVYGYMPPAYERFVVRETGSDQMCNGPLHIGSDGIYCNLCPTIVYQTWQLALEHVKIEHPDLFASLTQQRHLHIDIIGRETGRPQG